jgi:transcription elongation GreA/GreB family factor
LETFKIVGTTESDILLSVPKISNESPIGKALLGKKK